METETQKALVLYLPNHIIDPPVISEKVFMKFLITME